MKGSVGVWTAFLLFGIQSATCQTTAWLTDEQARVVAEAAVRSVDPRPCYSTYRDERLERLVLSLRKDRLVGNRLNSSVYFYRVASDVCDYVIEKDGKTSLMSEVTMDCCDYGIVAVDRRSARAYWFTGEKRAEVFRELARDEQLRPESPDPRLFVTLYRELVLGESGEFDITSLRVLRDAAQANFQSAYSPYERDTTWEQKFEGWWRQCRSRLARVNFETTYEHTSGGTKVRGYAFKGFELTIPRSDLPPKGTPTLFQWSLLVKPDGVIERLPSDVIYSAR